MSFAIFPIKPIVSLRIWKKKQRALISNSLNIIYTARCTIFAPPPRQGCLFFHIIFNFFYSMLNFDHPPSLTLIAHYHARYIFPVYNMMWTRVCRCVHACVQLSTKKQWPVEMCCAISAPPGTARIVVTRAHSPCRPPVYSFYRFRGGNDAPRNRRTLQNNVHARVIITGGPCVTIILLYNVLIGHLYHLKVAAGQIWFMPKTPADGNERVSMPPPPPPPPPRQDEFDVFIMLLLLLSS